MTTMQELARRLVVDDDEAARLDAEETMSFEPDLNDCSFAAVQYELASDPEAVICRLSNGATHAVLAEYQRQLSAAGLVMVRSDVYRALVNHYNGFPDKSGMLRKIFEEDR